MKTKIISGKLKTYAEQGAIVTIIAYSTPVYIVEDAEGSRFPVHESSILLIKRTN